MLNQALEADIRKFVLSLDFDDTLMVDNEKYDYVVNPDLIPLMSWAQKQGYPLVITTKRNPQESANLILDPNRESKTIDYCLKQLASLGIKIDKVITRYDHYDPTTPEEPGFYYKKNGIEAIEEEAVARGQVLDKEILAEQQTGQYLDWQEAISIRSREFRQKNNEISREKEKEFSAIYECDYSKVANQNKEAQLQTISEYYPHHSIVHLDDDVNIIKGLKAKKSALDGNLMFLHNVFPIHFLKSDKNRYWLNEMETLLGKASVSSAKSFFTSVFSNSVFGPFFTASPSSQILQRQSINKASASSRSTAGAPTQNAEKNTQSAVSAPGSRASQRT